MSAFANQNNIYFNGTFISGVSALTTGSPFKIQGFGKFSVVIEGLLDPNGINKASFTGTLQAIVHPAQTTWVNILSTGFNNNNGAGLFQTLGQFDAVRFVVNPYSSGICNVWFTTSQT